MRERASPNRIRILGLVENGWDVAIQLFSSVLSSGSIFCSSNSSGPTA